jgi:signal transduction histidine kinase
LIVLTKINDLLDFVQLRLNSFAMKNVTFDLREAIQEVVDTISLQASSKNIRLNAIIPTKKCKVFADKQRIVQVIICLVQNAIKFSTEGPI